MKAIEGLSFYWKMDCFSRNCFLIVSVRFPSLEKKAKILRELRKCFYDGLLCALEGGRIQMRRANCLFPAVLKSYVCANVLHINFMR